MVPDVVGSKPTIHPKGVWAARPSQQQLSWKRLLLEAPRAADGRVGVKGQGLGAERPSEPSGKKVSPSVDNRPLGR